MKTRKIIPEISSTINTEQLEQTTLQFFKFISLPIWLVIICISLSFVTKPVRAGTEDIKLLYRYVPYEGPGSAAGTAGEQRLKQSSGASGTEAKKAEASMSGEQKSPTESKTSPAKKPERDTGEFPSGEFPTFAQVDINGDHYVTKDELQNFPDLLRVFDKVDAGKDGKLEQHEYQNLETETTREGEVM
ncbi:MAG: EF-hand domain-containing protein [Methylobacter sp.]